jgi:glyoxylase-like metal-dependent hydrolase (beta-lactamase superfamily II)
VPGEQLRPVGGGDPARDGWHGRSLRDRSPRYHAVVGDARGWVEIGDRVFVRRYAFYDQNIGVILGDGEALVIDTRSTHVQGREILADLRALTAFPVNTVVDTHGHFDHAFGNHVFRPATIWGHEGCVSFMARTAEARRARIALEAPEIAADLAEVVVDPPDRTFGSSTSVVVGDRPVDLGFIGRGHTDHDILVTIPGADVLFVGDLLENGAVPFYGDAYPLDWALTAAAIAPRASGVVVPGHGDHADRAFAERQAASIAAVAELARRVHAGELTVDDAIAEHPFPDHPPADARRPLERALQQLRGELV